MAEGAVVACRSCGGRELEMFLSLGTTPLADALVDPDDRGPEPRYPLDVAFCPSCSLVQLLEEVPPKTLFVDNYLYFSSYSDDLVAHSRRHAVDLVERRGLDERSLVVEIASNDGYFLRHLVERGVPVLGVDPARGQAKAASAQGVPTLTEFFGLDIARELVASGRRADVIVANNVLAHVPDLNGVVAGMAELLTEDGIVTIENPCVTELVDRLAFDTIYHEHLCYFSCLSIDALASRHGLHLQDVQYFPDLHGGTLRWQLGRHDTRTSAVEEHLAEERARGVDRIDFYRGFSAAVDGAVEGLRELLDELKAGGARIAAYGAAAKGSTLLNVSGIGLDHLDYVVDRNPHKQGLLMPGVHVPVRDPELLVTDRPDHCLLLAWNFADEIVRQQQAYTDLGGRFILPIPEARIL